MKNLLAFAFCLMLVVTGAVAMEKTAGGGVAVRNFEELTGFGFFGFFGPGQYVELSVGYTRYSYDYGPGMDGNFGTIQFGAYGKYPFVMSERIVLFPTAGIEFEYDYEFGDTVFWILFGGGLDFFLNENMFLRTHLLLGRGSISTDYGDYSGFGQSLKVGIGRMF